MSILTGSGLQKYVIHISGFSIRVHNHMYNSYSFQTSSEVESWWKRKRKDKTKSGSSNAIHYSAIIMVSEAELNQYGNSSIAFPNYFGLAYVMPLLMVSFNGAISRLHVKVPLDLIHFPETSIIPRCSPVMLIMLSLIDPPSLLELPWVSDSLSILTEQQAL